MKTENELSPGELARKALKDTTKYDALELGHYAADDISKHLWESINKHRDIFDEDEFCVVMLIGKDPLIKNLIRRKFYCWPYLPKPRPNQAVFLYNKRLDKIIKRLWVLPCDAVMAELSSLSYVDKRYQTMQAWSIAFFKGTFWEYIRHEHHISMPSEHEYFLNHRDELIKAGCKYSNVTPYEAFDFGKITSEKIVYPEDISLGKLGFKSLGNIQDRDRNIGTHARDQAAV